MRKCKACGREIIDTAPFCKYCGAKAENEPKCGADLEANAMFCGNCGTSL